MAQTEQVLPKGWGADVDAFVDEKQTLEYGALMILQDLHKAGLRLLLERAAKADLIDPDLYTELYGRGEDAGHGVAGLTVPQLLGKWHKTTDNMVRALAGLPSRQ